MIQSIHTAVWHQRWSDDVQPFLERAAKIGFGGAEVSLLGDDASYAALRRTARELGLVLTATTGLSSQTDIGSEDPQVRAAGRRALETAVRSAATLGAQQLSGVIYGAWGRTNGKRREARLGWATEALSDLAPLALDAGVTLGIEAINRYETDLINTAEQAVKLASDVDAPNVGVLLDSYHMNIEEKDPAGAVRSTGSHLVHMHVSGRDRGVPNRLDLERSGLAEALGDVGFDGVITCEMFIQADQDVSEDLTVWRDIERDPTDAAKRALEVCKEWLP